MVPLYWLLGTCPRRDIARPRPSMPLPSSPQTAGVSVAMVWAGSRTRPSLLAAPLAIPRTRYPSRWTVLLGAEPLIRAPGPGPGIGRGAGLISPSRVQLIRPPVPERPFLVFALRSLFLPFALVSVPPAARLQVPPRGLEEPLRSPRGSKSEKDGFYLSGRPAGLLAPAFTGTGPLGAGRHELFFGVPVANGVDVDVVAPPPDGTRDPTPPKSGPNTSTLAFAASGGPFATVMLPDLALFHLLLANRLGGWGLCRRTGDGRFAHRRSDQSPSAERPIVRGLRTRCFVRARWSADFGGRRVAGKTTLPCRCGPVSSAPIPRNPSNRGAAGLSGSEALHISSGTAANWLRRRRARCFFPHGRWARCRVFGSSRREAVATLSERRPPESVGLPRPPNASGRLKELFGRPEQQRVALAPPPLAPAPGKLVLLDEPFLPHWTPRAARRTGRRWPPPTGGSRRQPHAGSRQRSVRAPSDQEEREA